MPSNANDWLSARQPQIQENLIELCEINSGSSNLSGLLEVLSV